MIVFFTKRNTKAESFQEIFDKQFVNSVTYIDRSWYIVKNPFSQYVFNYSGTIINIKGKRTFINSFFNNIYVFVNDEFYQSVLITDDTYHQVTLPVGFKKVSIIEGATTRPDNVGDVQGTWLVGLNLDINRYQKINTITPNETIVFLGDSITVGDHATYQIDGHSMLFYKNRKINTAVLGYGFARLFDFASDSTKINDTVSKIISLLGNVTNKKLVIALGTNDLGLSAIDATTWIGYYRNLLNAIHSADSSIQIYANEILRRGNYTSEVDAYNAQLNALQTELGYFTVIHCFGCITYWTNYGSDHLHPLTAGHLEYHNFEYNAIYN